MHLRTPFQKYNVRFVSLDSCNCIGKIFSIHQKRALFSFYFLIVNIGKCHNGSIESHRFWHVYQNPFVVWIVVESKFKICYLTEFIRPSLWNGVKAKLCTKIIFAEIPQYELTFQNYFIRYCKIYSIHWKDTQCLIEMDKSVLMFICNNLTTDNT